MFTKNYNRFCGYALYGVWDIDAKNMISISGKGELYRCSSPLYYRIAELLKQIANAANVRDGISNAAAGVVFASGTAAPTVDDYAFSGGMISGLSSSNVTYVLTRTIDDTGETYEITYTISNTTGADITIGEVGLVTNGNTMATESSSYSNHHYLLERTVLDAPVTIPAGGIGRVTYTIRLDYPVQ